MNKFGIGRNESLFIRKIRSCRLTPPLPDASVYHNLHPIRCLSSCVLGGANEEKRTDTHTHITVEDMKEKEGLLDLILGFGDEPKNFFPVGRAERHDLADSASLWQTTGSRMRDSERVLAHGHQFGRFLQHQGSLRRTTTGQTNQIERNS